MRIPKKDRQKLVVVFILAIISVVTVRRHADVFLSDLARYQFDVGNTSSLDSKLTEAQRTALPLGGPRAVVLVTYQRSGSSFLGEIFNQNNDSFTWFEPIDGVYNALYGTRHGYNVPADIWNHPNGSERKLPTYEIEAMAEVAKHILSCNFSALPVEVLAHHFIGMFLQEHVTMKPYHECINKHKHGAHHWTTCNKALAKTCPERFGTNVGKSEKCLHALLPHTFPHLASSWKVNASRVDSVTSKAIEAYKKCSASAHIVVDKCVHHLQTACNARSIKAIKPVRFPMEAAERLKELLPEVQIIHNLRDPRAVAHSRLHTSDSFQALFAKISSKTQKIDLAREAKLFCRNALKDVRTRKRIESGHSRSTLQVIYEQFASEPIQVAGNVYDFLAHPLPSTVQRWLLENTSKASMKQTQRNAKETLAKWQSEVTVAAMKAIDEYCQGLFQEAGHPWLYS